MYQKWKTVALSVILSLSLPVVSLASEPDFATPPDWDEVEQVNDTGIALFSSIQNVTNTVSYSGVEAYVSYYDMSSNIHYARCKAASDGYVSISRPKDFARIRNFTIRVMQKSLPPAGVYQVTYDFASDTYHSYTNASAVFGSVKTINNASPQASVSHAASFQGFSGDFVASAVIDLGNIAYMDLSVNFDPNISSSADGFPFAGYIKCNFTKFKGDSDFSTAGGSVTPDDVQKDISGNTGQIVENTNQIIYSANEINDRLKEIVQHISDQLAALWDQMYNYMHVPDLANRDMNTQRIIDAMNTDITVKIETDRENFNRLMENDNRNTEKIVNGYDKSGLESGNNILGDSLSAYDTAEDNVVSSVSGYLENFVMPSYSSAHPSVLSACLYFGGYLQKLYDGIGAFNFPIVISLTLIFVSMIVGYHRFISSG